MISVVVPTITGREHWLERCLDAYRFTTTGAVHEVIVIRDQPTCGVAWNLGASRASGDYLHFSADDLEPHHGWWQAAIATVEQGHMPCPRVLNPDGTLQSCGEWGVELPDGTDTYIARVPFMSWAQWRQVGPAFEGQYYGDNAISARGWNAGIRTVVTRGMVFTHHFASEGRLDHRMQEDYAAYQAFVQPVAS